MIIITFNYMYIVWEYVNLWEYVYMWMQMPVRINPEQDVWSLETGLQVAVRHLAWLLETQFRVLCKTVHGGK